jgi:predicted DNA-binding transcriptional regulator YafY
MSKISNVILMLQYLENGRKYNIKELSEKLEVSERMVRVYKEELEKAGIYIDTIMGPYGGYVLNQSIRIPTRKFTIFSRNLPYRKVSI